MEYSPDNNNQIATRMALMINDINDVLYYNNQLRANAARSPQVEKGGHGHSNTNDVCKSLANILQVCNGLLGLDLSLKLDVDVRLRYGRSLLLSVARSLATHINYGWKNLLSYLITHNTPNLVDFLGLDKIK